MTEKINIEQSGIAYVIDARLQNKLTITKNSKIPQKTSRIRFATKFG